MYVCTYLSVVILRIHLFICTALTCYITHVLVFKDGSLRLADSGSSITGGRLEIHKDGSWGTICDLGWDSNDALVACKQLGFANVEAEQSGSFPTGSGSILLSSVECNGDETSIISCPNSGFGNTPGCSHSQDVRIICSSMSAIKSVKSNDIYIYIQWNLNITKLLIVNVSV